MPAAPTSNEPTQPTRQKAITMHTNDSTAPATTTRVPTDPVGLAAAMDAEETQYGLSWLQREGNLHQRLTEQEGHRAGVLWGDACQWADRNARAKTVTALRAHLAAGDIAAAAAAAETAYQLSHYLLGEDWQALVTDLEYATDLDPAALRERIDDLDLREAELAVN